MANTVQQAEAGLRVAALEYVAAYDAYSKAFDRNGDMARYGAGVRDAPLHPETEAACKLSNSKQNAMCDAARALRDAIAAEQRAEAL
jgi:hypothetical protein